MRCDVFLPVTVGVVDNFSVKQKELYVIEILICSFYTIFCNKSMKHISIEFNRENIVWID